ncbi:MAG TPA: hypothetical protein VFQ53_43360 [Kofleriaceae bacterium]|nr:hypothetical protein [Kofleriaceae bacterium]
MTLLPDRMQTLIIARTCTSTAPLNEAELARALRRFAPPTLTDSEWATRVHDAAASVSGSADPSMLVERIGKHGARTWAHLADRVLPLLGLGVAAGDAKVSARLSSRDAWTAAIAGRLLGLWRDGAPPSLAAVCDAYAWHRLGLAGKPKRCPPEIRAMFLQRELATEVGAPDRLLRLYVARELEAPRPELRVLRDALVRRWLMGRELATVEVSSPRASFASEVKAAAREARQGVFGDRKVFISSVWDDLRRRPSWSSLTLDDFKHRLLTAHRAGDVVLARADLVAAMNPELVAASETQTDGASFHFIVREAV